MVKTISDCGGFKPQTMTREQFQAAKDKAEKTAKKTSTTKKK